MGVEILGFKILDDNLCSLGLIREIVAEILGTFFLIFLGCGGECGAVLGTSFCFITLLIVTFQDRSIASFPMNWSDTFLTKPSPGVAGRPTTDVVGADGNTTAVAEMSSGAVMQIGFAFGLG